jgi:cysteine-rich repeat protein
MDMGSGCRTYYTLEPCDDGNNEIGDGCTPYCKIEPDCTVGGGCTSACGDGLIIGDEECDDGNAIDGDGCSSTCQVEPGYTCAPAGTVENTMEIPIIYKDFNASGDGVTLDTKAIQNTVDACYASGGGTVVVPAGIWLTGCIELKSNINLHLEPGAVLLGSTNKDDYKIIVPDFESRTNDLYVNRSIIYAEKAENVSLTGTGIINGSGKHKNYSFTHPQNNRPFLARFVNCSNVTIRDVSMIESANWTCHLLGCKDVLIDGLKIENSVRANRDGLDIDGCENITVSNCRIYSMDDAIVFKSTGPAN